MERPKGREDRPSYPRRELPLLHVRGGDDLPLEEGGRLGELVVQPLRKAADEAVPAGEDDGLVEGVADVDVALEHGVGDHRGHRVGGPVEEDFGDGEALLVEVV